ncbi:unnamed protein product [Protopolystoma xenopodis]|uniref:Uncharacterized protein n=1 Tax=Protopolystoma xenopodis TaxID=117903 RepID=A0A3S5C2A0_9PLAT|nr:unnamed protein product [Protopolystoma xenopodis]
MANPTSLGACPAVMKAFQAQQTLPYRQLYFHHRLTCSIPRTPSERSQTRQRCSSEVGRGNFSSRTEIPEITRSTDDRNLASVSREETVEAKRRTYSHRADSGADHGPSLSNSEDKLTVSRARQYRGAGVCATLATRFSAYRCFTYDLDTAASTNQEKVVLKYVTLLPICISTIMGCLLFI